VAESKHSEESVVVVEQDDIQVLGRRDKLVIYRFYVRTYVQYGRYGVGGTTTRAAYMRNRRHVARACALRHPIETFLHDSFSNENAQRQRFLRIRMENLTGYF
jgi:hypothetical protein